MQSVERVRTDSTGSAVSTDDSEQGGAGALGVVLTAGLPKGHWLGSPEARLWARTSLTSFPLSSPEVDIESMEFGSGELDSVGSGSDVDDHYSLQSGGCGANFGPPCRRPGRPGLS